MEESLTMTKGSGQEEYYMDYYQRLHKSLMALSIQEGHPGFIGVHDVCIMLGLRKDKMDELTEIICQMEGSPTSPPLGRKEGYAK